MSETVGATTVTAAFPGTCGDHRYQTDWVPRRGSPAIVTVVGSESSVVAAAVEPAVVKLSVVRLVAFAMSSFPGLALKSQSSLNVPGELSPVPIWMEYVVPPATKKASEPPNRLDAPPWATRTSSGSVEPV